MAFIEYTNQWIKGEIFEAKLILAFSLLVIVIALFLHFTGTTHSSKALFWPLLLVGVMFLSIGGGMLYSNPKRAIAFPQKALQDEQTFILSEKERVEGFMKWYPVTRWVMTGFGLFGIGLFLFLESPLGRAIGVALILMMLTSYVVDHFSEERASAYYHHIINQ